MLTLDDVKERDAALAQLASAEQAVRDLAERFASKGDVIRSGMIRTGAAWRLERAYSVVEDAFR